jgi:hypothetical protein
VVLYGSLVVVLRVVRPAEIRPFVSNLLKMKG